MRIGRADVRLVAMMSLVCSVVASANQQTTVLQAPICPDRPFPEIRAAYRPPAVAPGVAIIDRERFWTSLDRIARAEEVFRFTATRKDKETGLASTVQREVSLSKSVVHGERRTTIEAILDRWEQTGGGHPKHLALILGTAYRETCGILASTVGEACGCAKVCVKDEYNAASYGRKDSCGRAFFGRGFVQLTHKSNYESVGKRLRIPLMEYPALAYEQPFAIMMLVDGVKGRWYAGRPLDTYLDDFKSDWVRARDSVNPGSPNRAATGYLACRFYDAIQPAYKSGAPPQDPALCSTLTNF